MKSIKNLKIKGDYKNPLMLLVHEYDMTNQESSKILGCATLKRKTWKKEFLKYYEALTLNAQSYLLQILTTKDGDPCIACDLLGEEIIEYVNNDKNNDGE